MKPIVAASLIALVSAYASPVAASCQDPRLSDIQLNTVLSGNTVCGRPIMPAEGGGYPGNPNDRWQEEHQGAAPGGALWDYKKGNPPAETVDPRKQVGTWAIITIAPGVYGVRHTYLDGAYFDWTVHSIPPAANNRYSFCARTTEFARGKVKPGINVGCAAGDFPP